MHELTLGRPASPVPARIWPDPEALAEGLAHLILAQMRAAASEGRAYVLGCPGGRSPMPTYQALGRLAADAGADLSGVILAMMDEYLLGDPDRGFTYCPLEAHYSCRRAARDEIAGVINAGLPSARRIRADQVWFPEAQHPEHYDQRLQHAGGVDLFIVAMGAGDGHVAFNPPGTPADAGSRLIEIAETTRRDNLRTFPDFADESAVPRYGVSVGLGTIAELSRAVVLIAWGADKRAAVRRLAAYDDFDPQWPASIVYRCRAPRIYLDRAAAADLTETFCS